MSSTTEDLKYLEPYIDMKFSIVDVNILKINPAEPEDRIMNMKALGELSDEIAAIGMLYPPIVSIKDNIIGDGHRRWSAWKMLYRSQIPILYSDLGSAQLFASANQVTKKLTGSDYLLGFYKTGVLPKGRTGTTIKKLNEIAPEIIPELIAQKKGASIVEHAAAIMRYIDDDRTSGNLKKIVLWLHNYKCVMQMQHLLRRKYDSRKIRDWINRDETPII